MVNAKYVEVERLSHAMVIMWRLSLAVEKYTFELHGGQIHRLSCGVLEYSAVCVHFTTAQFRECISPPLCSDSVFYHRVSQTMYFTIAYTVCAARW